MLFRSAVGVMPFVKENRLRAIAVSTKERFPVLPAIPTASESGLKGYDASSWQGIVMPAGVALDIRQRMSDEIAKALKTAALRERVLDLAPRWHLFVRGQLGVTAGAVAVDLPGTERFFAGGDQGRRVEPDAGRGLRRCRRTRPSRGGMAGRTSSDGR